MLPKKWIRWIGMGLGIAAIVTPALLDLGWIPQTQALNAMIFLIGFLILDWSASKPTDESITAPELYINSEDFYNALGKLTAESRHEVLIVLRGDDVIEAISPNAAAKMWATLRREKQLHLYIVVASRISDMTEASFKRRLALDRDPSFEGRIQYRFVDTPVTFGCAIYDQKHWSIDFPPNPADPKGGAIIFRDHAESARLVASFIRHQWLERPGITMSLDEAYAKWQALQGSASASS